MRLARYFGSVILIHNSGCFFAFEITVASIQYWRGALPVQSRLLSGLLIWLSSISGWQAEAEWIEPVALAEFTYQKSRAVVACCDVRLKEETEESGGSGGVAGSNKNSVDRYDKLTRIGQ